jgi:hypothetical protein
MTDVLKAIFFLETRSHYMVQVALELEIFLPQPPECWDYRCAPPHTAENNFPE